MPIELTRRREFFRYFTVPLHHGRPPKAADFRPFAAARLDRRSFGRVPYVMGNAVLAGAVKVVCRPRPGGAAAPVCPDAARPADPASAPHAEPPPRHRPPGQPDEPLPAPARAD